MSKYTMKRRSRRPGHRFYPTEGELMFYLKRKVMQKKVPAGDISELDIYKYAPWDLPDKSGMKKGDLKCYFYCPRAKKHGRGTKIERKTEFGHWKSTGQDKPVVHNGKVLGMRKILTFSASKGDQTSWVMHEYRIEEKNLDAYVLCEIFEKGGRGPRNGSYEEEDYDWDDDGLEEVDISTGLSVPPSKEPHNSFALEACTTLSNTVGCSSASCILENFASTSEEIPQIVSGSIAPVETPHSLENFDDGITMEELFSENGNSNSEDGDEFQATVPAFNNTDQPDDTFEGLENLHGWSDKFLEDERAYNNTGNQVMHSSIEPFMELNDLDAPLRLTNQDLWWIPDAIANISGSSQLAGLQENIPLNSNEGYNNGYSASRPDQDWNPP